MATDQIIAIMLVLPRPMATKSASLTPSRLSAYRSPATVVVSR